MSAKTLETTTLASGCFWCTEAIFKRLKGIVSVESGYSGGETEYPTYEQVCFGTTGHAESIQIKFDPSVISYDKILEVFFATHNPTTKDRQGNDIGSQYRSAIFYHTDEQKKIAEATIRGLEKSGKFKDSIVTQISPFTAFYKAEPHHQNYYDRNRDYPYCTAVINPKIQKLFKEFKKDVISD